MKSKNHFEVKTKNGDLLTFDKQCNSVDYSNSIMCVFKNNLSNGDYITLAIIPHSEICYIVNVND